MTAALSDRRLSVREKFKIPIRVRIWKSANQEELGESENLSKRGILFATDSVIPVGTTLEIFLKMPEMINGESTNEWLYSGHVVRVEPSTSTRGHFGVGVQFDCYQPSGGNEARSN
ncbi:MAG: hypothetical protein JWO71_4083 [Candidatus Acidoferrum typicum]|nr:hypothetical protein [Candidatus Acidoferrum typicum]